MDSDEVVRNRILSDPEVVKELIGHFGAEVAGKDGGVDRSAVGIRVFSNEADLRWLESVVHPRLYGIWRTEFAAVANATWVVEVPLLFEKALENWFDFTVCVACSREQQLVRLEQRGLPRGLAGQRISSQLPLEKKIERSDFVLWNEGSPKFLEAAVDRLTKTLVSQS